MKYDQQPVKVTNYHSDEFIAKIKTKFLNEIYSKQKHLYDPEDIECLRKNDWWIHRFLAWRDLTEEYSLKVVDEALQWRHRTGVRYIEAEDFPIEFYKSAALFTYKPDLNGYNIVIFRLKTHRKHAEFEELVRRYFIYTCNKITEEHPGCGFSLIFDCSGASITNVDLDNMRFIIATLSKYFAGVLGYVLVYELPWILKSFWSIVKNWLHEADRHVVKFATKKSIQEFIHVAHLPDYMGGCNPLDYRAAPKGSPAIEEVARALGFKSTDVNRIATHFQKLCEQI